MGGPGKEAGLSAGFGHLLPCLVACFTGRELPQTSSPSLSQILGSLQKKLPLMTLSTTMAESFKELDTESSLG